MQNINIQKKSGIYEYVLTGNEKCLYLRTFTSKQKLAAYDNQKGLCARCHQPFNFSAMEGDHVLSWLKGGTTEDDNLEMLCVPCHLIKTLTSLRSTKISKKEAH
jgi:5-methylcytosine-specific restriction endonuclease McrA